MSVWVIFDRVIEPSLQIDVRFDPDSDRGRTALQYVAKGHLQTFLHSPFEGRTLTDQPTTRLTGPRKSILPTSTPLWRRMAYAIAMWKKVLGIVICSR
jgi:hypothetical protein